MAFNPVMNVGNFVKPLGVAAARASGRNRPDTPTPFLPAEEQESWTRALARNTGSMIDSLGWVLDTPGAAMRGVLAGDPLSIFSLDPERRVSGDELAESYGLINKDTDSWTRTGVGLATEILTDPLAWISGPMSSLTKAGKAAKAANILDLAPIAAQTKMGTTQAAKTMTGAFTDAAYDRLLPHGLARNVENFRARPLLGPRLARTQATLEDVVQASNNPQAALDDVLKYLSTTGDAYDDIKGQQLGGALGFGFFKPWVTFTPPGSAGALDTMDYLGQVAGWSKPGRVASAWFDKRMAGQTGELDQIAMLRRSNMVEEATKEGRRKAVQHAMTLSEIPVTPTASALLGSDTLFSRQGNEFLTRLFENKPTAADLVLKRELPGIEAAVDSWDQLRKANIAQSNALGMRVNQYSDKYGVLYSPRSADEIDFEDMGGGVGRSMYMTSTAEMFSRKNYLITPGGTDDLRFVSTLPIVRQHNKFRGTSQFTDSDVGRVIAAELNKKHGMDAVTDEQGAYIAKMMYRINKDLPGDYPVFAQHPVAAQARTIVNQEVAAANARFVYESMAEAAIRKQNTLVTGGGFRRLDHALNDVAKAVGLRVGTDGNAAKSVVENMRKVLQQRMGLTGNVDLSQLSIPETVFNRLMRVNEFYYSPKAQQEVANLFNRMTSLTKAFLLAWPSRHVRDVYSNAYSVWLETGSVTDTWAGFSAASKILAGRFDDAIPFLRQIPQYQKLADPAAIKKQVMQDAGGSGVLTTLATSDLLTANIKGDVAQLLPGSTPLTTTGALKGLVPDGSRNPLQMARDFFAIRNVSNRFETRNPMLNVSSQLNDLTDSMARLGGYLALLRRGVTPDAAAKRMTQALVDYSSLTPIEKNVFRNIFPWWAYNSRIGKYVVQQLMQRPGGRYAQTIRAMNVLQAADDEHYIPSSLRQQFAVRIPDEYRQYLGMGLGGKANTTTYLTDIDLPGIDTLSIIRPGSLQQTAAELFNQAHPMLRSGAEYVFNRDFYTGRPLDEATTRADRLYKAVTGSPFNLSPLAKTAIENVPGTQRLVNLFGGLADERVPFEHALPRELVNALLGVKFRDVDEEWILYDMLNKLKPELEGYAIHGSYSSIPEERLQVAPPRVSSAYNMTRQIGRRKAELKKQRLLQGVGS